MAYWLFKAEVATFEHWGLIVSGRHRRSICVLAENGMIKRLSKGRRCDDKGTSSSDKE